MTDFYFFLCLAIVLLPFTRLPVHSFYVKCKHYIMQLISLKVQQTKKNTYKHKKTTQHKQPYKAYQFGHIEYQKSSI